MRFTNTLGGKVEDFAPLDPSKVRVYSCGPTVYGPAHVGNFRAFLLGDIVTRYLRWSGFTVTWVMNITDVDDRIIKDLMAKGVTLEELTAPHIERFVADLGKLHIGPPDKLARATEHIPEMATIIKKLVDNGHAYAVDDGSIFFRISTWPSYGVLAKLDPEQAQSTERVAADDYGKDDVRDFAVWKGTKPGEPSWNTEVGTGRPGWHIECSAMSMKYLGESFDIHTGGVDLIFPHHENEIAQSEASTGKHFVNVWLHNAHLHMSGEKMARRVGNIERPAEVYEAGYSPTVLRYALIATHYRAPLDWGGATLKNARAAVERLSTTVARLEEHESDTPDDPGMGAVFGAAREAFIAAMDDDLNVSGALAAEFDLVRELNRRGVDERTLSTADAKRGAEVLRDFDRVLGVIEEDEKEELPTGAQELLDERADARSRRDYAASDLLRDKLAALGVAVEDTPDGQRWRLMPPKRDG